MSLKPAAFYLLATTYLNMFKRYVCSEVEKKLGARKLFPDIWSLLEREGEGRKTPRNLGSVVQYKMYISALFQSVKMQSLICGLGKK